MTPAGWSSRETWHQVVGGKSCIGRIERFTTFAASSRVAGLVPGREGPLGADSLSAEYGVAAATEAIGQACLEPAAGPVDVAVVANHGERRLPGHHSDTGRVLGIPGITARVAAACGAARSSAIYGACAGSAQAIGLGMKLIQSGQAEVVLAGGCDALVTPFDFFSFSSLYVMSTRDCPPEEASCPFDVRRDGFVLAEGAAFLVLEDAAHARARGADPLAAVEGFGLTQNAYHMFAPPPDGRGPRDAMRQALHDARLDPGDIGWINAHGTSTKDNDVCESLAIHSVFGSAAGEIPVSSNKSQLGHTMGACGAIEAVISVHALAEQVVPPTVNLDSPDPACALQHVPWTARPARFDHVLSNSFGFGGHSASLILGRV